MCPKQIEPLEAWAKPATEAFQFWISLFPVAPMFGVAWRFAKMVPSAPDTPTFLKPFASAMQAAPGAAEAMAPLVVTPPRATQSAAPTEAPTGVFEPLSEAAKPAKTAKPRRERPAMPEPDAVAVPETPAPETPAPAAEIVVEAVAATPPAADAVPADVAAPLGRPAGLMDTPPAVVDDLKLLRGIGPGLEKQLNALGVYTFAQLAGFSQADLTWVDDNLTAFKGRCFRDDWIGQARALLA